MSDPVLDELKLLRDEVTKLRHAVHHQRVIRHGWLKLFINDLETNPHSQFTVHKYGMYYWIINFPLITLLFFFEPALWLKLGIFITLIYSIYANFATDYGSMSSALAAYSPSGDGLPEIPLEAHVPKSPVTGS